MNRRAFLAAGTGAATIACTKTSREDSSLPLVRLGMPRNPIFYLPAYLAQSLGFYRAQGLRVELQDLPGGAKNVEAMLGGSTDAIGAVYEHTIWLAAESRMAQCFYLLMERPGLMLVVSPSTQRQIHHIADLPGAAVGVATPGSQSHLFLNYVLHKNGLPQDSVKTVGIGLGPGSVAAVERGKVDAAAISGSSISIVRRRHANLTVLADACSAEGVQQIYGIKTYPSHAMLAPTQWLQANPDKALKLTRALQQANDWLHSHSVEEIQEKIPAAYRLEDTYTELDAIKMAVPMYSTTGRVQAADAEGVRQVMDVSLEKVRNARIDLAKTYTAEYLPAGS